MTLIFFFFYVIGVREITNSLSRTFGQRRGRSFSPAIPWPESVSSNIVSNNGTTCSCTTTSTTTTKIVKEGKEKILLRLSKLTINNLCVHTR